MNQSERALILAPLGRDGPLAASLLGLASLFVSPVWWLVLLVAGLALVVLYVRMPRLFGERK